MADLKFISESDLEILNALKLANEITEKYKSNSVRNRSDPQSTISSEDVFVNGAVDSQGASNFSSDCGDFISGYNSFKFDSEYDAVCHDVECINVMCNLFIEKNQNLEMNICSFIKNASLDAEEIISTKHLGEKHVHINNTLEHLMLICDKMYRIQQVLQEKPCERTLKVNPSCQKAVLKCFTISNEIMDKLQQQLEYMENYQSENALGIQSHHKELKSTLCNKILELAKRIDMISQFRNQILPSFIYESNLDMPLS